ESAGMLASLGSLPVTNCPSEARTPLPASGNHCQSLSFWAPYFWIEKLESFARFWPPSLATHPIVGIVSNAFAFAALLPAIKSSFSFPAVEMPGCDSRLSKYQSLPRLSQLHCQLYCEVALPPLRFSGALRSESCVVEANATP